MTTPTGPTREITRAITAIDRGQVDVLGALRHGAVVALVLAGGLAWATPAVAVACAIGSLQVAQRPNVPVFMRPSAASTSCSRRLTSPGRPSVATAVSSFWRRSSS